MSTILVVEDHDAVALGLEHGLIKEGYQVERAATAAEGVELASRADLVVLDIRLPDGNGFDVCRQIRASGMKLPIIMLTARDEMIDKVLGLEAGADDYMTKPFELRELVARVRAHLRRNYGEYAASSDPQSFSIGEILIDLSGQRVEKNGDEIHLTQTEFKLLVYLAQNQNRPHSRDNLIDDIWGYDEFVGDPRTVDVHIRNLRMKIEDDPAQPRYIQTVRGAGYKLVG